MDYLTDDESDDGQEFEVPVPDLAELIKGFEEGDEKIAEEEAALKAHLGDLKSRGFEKEPREEIKQRKLERTELLDANISEQRKLLQAAMPGMVEELNGAIVDPANKIYLR